VRLMRPKFGGREVEGAGVGRRVVLQEVAGHSRVVYICFRGGEEAEGKSPACEIGKHSGDSFFFSPERGQYTVERTESLSEESFHLPYMPY
jgi:hypothetical protein